MFPIIGQEVSWREDQRQRLATGHRVARVQLARAARCERIGCHPVIERVSRSVLLLAFRLHAWATPVSRRESVPTPPESVPFSST